MVIADVDIVLESPTVIGHILNVAVFDSVSETLITGANVQADSTVLPEVTQGEYEAIFPSGTYSLKVFADIVDQRKGKLLSNFDFELSEVETASLNENKKS